MSYLSSLGALSVVALVLAIVATVLAFIFIVPEKRRQKMNAFGKFLHDTCNFKYLIVEKILQALYIFLTVYVILCGFFMLVMAPQEYWTGRAHWLGGYGILVMIVGPILVRLVYELLMMSVLLVKNVIGINNKLRSQNDGAAQADVFAGPDMSEVKAAIQKQKSEPKAAKFCSNCGTALDEDGHCPHCDGTSDPQ